MKCPCAVAQVVAQDFTEVDNNVTRHVPEELLNEDWNTMVMHYLGLDHIGHKAGPRRCSSRPQVRQMSSVLMLCAQPKHAAKANGNGWHRAADIHCNGSKQASAINTSRLMRRSWNE